MVPHTSVATNIFVECAFRQIRNGASIGYVVTVPSSPDEVAEDIPAGGIECAQHEMGAKTLVDLVGDPSANSWSFKAGLA